MWYLVPFFDYYITQDMKIQHASARTIQERGAILPQLLHHFWISGQATPLGDNGMQYSHPVGTGLILVAAVILFWLLLFLGDLRGEKGPEKNFAIKAAGLGCLALWMSTGMGNSVSCCRCRICTEVFSTEPADTLPNESDHHRGGIVYFLSIPDGFGRSGGGLLFV